MITIRFRDGMFCPVAICDECKGEITNAGAAMYAWFVQDDSVDSDMFTLHKDCSRLFEEKNRHLARNRYPWIMWEEMSNLPWALASNTGCLLLNRKWLGKRVGATEQDEYGPDWKRLSSEARQRDGHKCVNCGKSDCRLAAHHIVPLGSGGTNTLGNLVTLCSSCHRKAHRKQGV